jgi:secreted trypsin-like serine protease
MLPGRETPKAARAFTVAVISAVALVGSVTILSQSAVADEGSFVRPTPLIVNGKAASITDAPWQVALIGPRFGGGDSKPADRYFCTGSLLAPDVVVTAAHCVSGLSRSERKATTGIAGRTWLNQTGTGEVAGVRKALFALRPDGSRRFRELSGSATWDVALLKLDRQLTAPVIRLAGSPEADVWTPGRKVTATGWGVTSWSSARVSNRLRTAAQVILPDIVCRRDNGPSYAANTMVCLGGSAGSSSTCSGDSGGPLFARTSDGFRLVGLTSFGDYFCRGNLPSVDTRVSGDAIRSWVRQKTIELSGVNPVGTEGEPGPKPDYCRVPNLFRRSKSSARVALGRAGCTLGRVEKVNRRGYGSNRVVGAFLPGDWLAPVGFPVRVAITR